ncbi:MAG TPA: oligopeptide/dipeptide ABC transporter ATP-binding protein [Terriglobia bacterium]|nr:oligopeptide/dipeptide ABC transporter ATP-binding protein [Terriglobia bacterium]
MARASAHLLEIRNLSVEFQTHRGPFRAVDGIDLTLDAGELLGVVGESGSGKSVTMLAVMGLIAWPGKVMADKLTFDGVDLLSLSPRARRKIVGKDIAMIFQEPMTSLNPCFTVGFQIMEALKVHEGGSRAERKRRTIELLEQVGIPAPETRLSAFPHQLSGGMSQRVMIAMAIACNPRLLIADEPTTALDVTIQAQILDLLVSLQRDRGMALVLITHDMGVVAETAQRVSVMYASQQVEEQPVDQLFADPHHPYTAALLEALPERSEDKLRLNTIPGMVPGIADRPTGCVFNPRCSFADDHCRAVQPPLAPVEGRGGGHQLARCHYPLFGGMPSGKSYPPAGLAPRGADLEAR